MEPAIHCFVCVEDSIFVEVGLEYERNSKYKKCEIYELA